jgi:endonuclease/exonuclease/phosphatase family metal-dependent hydrolase
MVMSSLVRASILRPGAMSRLVFSAAALAMSVACAHTTSYLDPAGPRYEHTFAPPAERATCDAPGRAFTVVTFNIEYAKKIDLAIDVLRTTPVLKDADVLLLQEMDRDGAERIATALSLNALLFPSGVHPRTHRDFGTAVLSRWPLEGGRKILLPHKSFGTNFIRAVTAATVVCGSHRVGVMSVHLPSPFGASDADRRDQVDAILASARSIDGPLIVAGDFNARWVGTRFEQAGFRWLNKDQPATASFLAIGLKLDHVFARGFGPAADAASAGVADGRGASDHRPLWVRVQWPADGR